MSTLAKQEQDEIDSHNHYIGSLQNEMGNAELTADELWHFDRRLGIGGSDVGAILGLNKYKTAYDVYREKRGEAEINKTSEFAHFGKVLEQVVADEYVRRTGDKVRRAVISVASKSMPWMRANLDRIVEGQQKILECKTADKWAATKDDWGEGNTYQTLGDGLVELIEACDMVPSSYLVQPMHYMIVKEWRESDLAVLIGGNDFRIYTIPYHEKLANIIIDACYQFWFDHVIPGIPPTPQRITDLEHLYAEDNGETLQANDEIVTVCTRINTIKKQIKDLETEAYGPKVKSKFTGGLDLIVKRFMKENSLIDDDNKQKLCSWKWQASNRIDTQQLKAKYPEIAKEVTSTTRSRVFRI